MLARETHQPFNDKDWLFEIKWDGFRALAYIDDGVSLRSRNNQELIRNFPELKELTQQAPATVLDGEIIILSEGKVDFQALLERRRMPSPKQIWLKTKHLEAVYVVFDILERDGKPLLDLPLIERKKILKEAVKEGPHVLSADYVEEKGEAYYQIALDKGLEGVIAKKKDSPYESGLRSGNWLKIKKMHALDAVIFGYTHGGGIRGKTFGSLVMGLFDVAGKPVSIGRVGSGFSEKTLQTLLESFQRLKTDTAPFEVEDPQNVTWLLPELVAEVTYQSITKDNQLRIAQFQKLRTDKPARECTTEQLAGETKGQVMSEYEAKRHFERTPEPIGGKPAAGQPIFVVQKHHARRLHYDFRLERDGVLKSWAVPKGIPEVGEKRLAVETEDHPLDYAKFAGEIPKGEYGAGQVVIWDHGTFETKVWTEKMIEVLLNGEKLKGRYVLVPLKPDGEKRNWLMLKGKDAP
jgi:DNA ligase D-like protein (predicted ligase)/DNA ligase D-like protein (predicted 3'-phosphoesterase)